MFASLVIKFAIFAFLFFNTFLVTEASLGDSLSYFVDCLDNCHHENCSSLPTFEAHQSKYLLLLGWNCEEECKHGCQWKTLEYLSDEIGLHYSEMPQFYGKWTFVRILGIQEPASAVFSMLNLMTTYVAWKRFRRSVSGLVCAKDFSKKDSYFSIITANAFLSMNAWLWSTLYHIRETPSTEKLDYFSAFAAVLSSFYLVLIKVIEESNFSVKSLRMRSAVAVVFLSFYVYHVSYLTYVHFDYGYNMKVNLMSGFLTFFLWCWRSYYNYRKDRKFQVIKCLLSIACVNLLLLLEIYDFPPILNTFDAHALWHLGTIPFPLVWYSFLSGEASVA